MPARRWRRISASRARLSTAARPGDDATVAADAVAVRGEVGGEAVRMGRGGKRGGGRIAAGGGFGERGGDARPGLVESSAGRHAGDFAFGGGKRLAGHPSAFWLRRPSSRRLRSLPRRHAPRRRRPRADRGARR
jgi:hypothetical protein